MVRYIKLFLGICKIDILGFTAQSVTIAQQANNIGLSIKDIQKAANWGVSNTFERNSHVPLRNLNPELLISC